MQKRKNEDFFVSLKPLRKAKKLREVGFYTFDCETKDGLVGKQLYCWGLGFKNRGGKNELTALQGKEDLEPLFKHIAKWQDKTHYKIVFVHNLTFDARFLIDWMANNGMEYFPIISGSNFLALIIEELKVKFVDTVQFLKCSQEEAEIEWEIDEELRKINCHSIFKKKYSKWSQKDKDKVFNHNKNDVMALHQVMDKFRKTIFEISRVDCLNCVSLAGVAMKAFRKEMKGTILNPFVYKRVNEETRRFYLDYDDIAERFVRESYYGGRNEVFNRRKLEKMSYFDKVSMYPAIMGGNKSTDIKFTNDKKEPRYYSFPSGNPSWAKNNHNDKKLLMDIIKGKRHELALISVKVKPKIDEYYPVLPKRILKRVMFTNCSFTGIYTSVELQYAYKRGYRFELNSIDIQSENKQNQWVRSVCGMVFPFSENYFTDFVDKFFRIKSTNKGGKKKGAKIILNSTYGKMGEQFKKKSPLVHYFVNEMDALNYLEFHDKPKKVHLKKHKESKLWIAIESEESVKVKPYMNISIATFITAYARLELIGKIHNLEDKSIFTKYCDTDSITAKTGIPIKLSKNLGAWDTEKIFDEVRFLAPKAYISVKGKECFIKLKGVGTKKIKEIIAKVNKMVKNGKIKREDMMGVIEKLIRQPIQMAERYMNFRESHRYGVILASKEPCKHYSFENLKRNFFKNGLSEAWNDETIPIKFVEGLNQLELENIKQSIKIVV